MATTGVKSTVSDCILLEDVTAIYTSDLKNVGNLMQEDELVKLVG